MIGRKKYLVLALLLKVNCLLSQSLTGTWQGDLEDFEFLQVTILQSGNTLCGYTWDSVYNKENDYCKAYFTGRYDYTSKEWVLTGTSFIANSGGHILMRLIFSDSIYRRKGILQGWESSASSRVSVFSKIFGAGIYLTRISKKTPKILPGMQDCVPKKKAPVTQTKKITVDPKKQFIKPEKVIIENKADTARKIFIPAVPVMRYDSNKIVKAMVLRKNKEMTQLIVHEKKITLDVYDNGIVDSDTVSIFYNGKLVLSHQKLTEKPIILPIVFDENTTHHEITLFAENLGSIPPNTALIVVHAGDKRYELFASASLTENAVISFEYRPGK